MLNRVQVVSGLVMLGVMVFVGKPLVEGQSAEGETLASVQETPEESSDIPVCEKDRDCIAVPDGCCGCNEGGKKRAINRKYYSYWLGKKNDSCIFTRCESVLSDHLSCQKELKAKCVNSQCVMK